MQKIKSKKLHKYLPNIYLLIISFEILVALQNSLVDLIDSYAPYSWMIDYSFGFCKRGMLGTIFHVVLVLFDYPFDFNLLNSTISKVHIISSIISAVFLAFFFYSCNKNKAYNNSFLFTIFFGFIASSFLKNCFSLTGYTDLYLFLIFLIILLYLIKNIIYIPIIVCIFSCLISELSLIFWLPIFLLSFIGNKPSIGRMLLLVLPIVTALFVSFYHYPLEHLNIFVERFGFNSDDISKEMLHSLEGQRNLEKYVIERFEFLKINFWYCLCIFLFTSFFSIFFFTIAIHRLIIRNELHLYSFLIVMICVFLPLSIHFLAVDFWRISSFTIYSGFITNIYLEYRLSTNISKKFINRPKFYITNYIIYTFLIIYFASSILYLFLPPMRSDGWLTAPYTPVIFKNSVGTDPFIFEPLLADTDLYYTLLARFNYDTKNVFNMQSRYQISIPQEGITYFANPQAYGLTRIEIDSFFYDNDIDEVKNIYIFNFHFQIKRNTNNLFYVYIPPVISKQFPVLKLTASKSNHDWLIKRISVERVEK